MKPTFQAFGGIAPGVNPRSLPERMGQIAENMQVLRASGSLRPLAAPVATTDQVALTANTIYLYGTATDAVSQRWLSWAGDVDVVRGQISGDTEEWTHYTGDGAPKSVYASALSSPIPLGVDFPDTKPTVRTWGDPPTDSSNETPETRVYIVTFVRNIGGLAAESEPSPASDAIEVYASSQYALITLPDLPLASNITHMRIYRSTSGTYLYVQKWPASYAGQEVADAKLAADLGEECPSILWNKPPDELEGLVNLPNGIVAGFKGRDIYFCDPYHPYAWPGIYTLALDHPVVALGVIDTTLVALTTGQPYFIQGSHPSVMVQIETGFQQACVSKRSVVSMNGAVYYASPDGLVMISPGSTDIVTKDHYTKEEWNALNPETFRAYGHDLQYIAFRQTDGGTRVGWIYDLMTREPTTTDVAVRAAYSDLQSDILFCVTDADTFVKRWNSGTALTATWRSKMMTMPRPVGFGWAQVLAESYPVTLNVYADGQLLQTRSFSSKDPRRLPVGQFRDWEIEVVTDKEVYAVSIAQAAEEFSSG